MCAFPPAAPAQRLVTGKLLYVVKGVAKQELQNEDWLRMVADLGGRSYQEMRVIVLEFLDTDIFNLSRENCVTFLDPLIVATLAVELGLNPRCRDMSSDSSSSSGKPSPRW